MLHLAYNIKKYLTIMLYNMLKLTRSWLLTAWHYPINAHVSSKGRTKFKKNTYCMPMLDNIF